MDVFLTQHADIVSYTQIHNWDTLMEFYTNCFNYAPDLFIILAVIAFVGGFYLRTTVKKVKAWAIIQKFIIFGNK